VQQKAIPEKIVKVAIKVVEQRAAPLLSDQFAHFNLGFLP
jgi:hypothetical protein